MIINSNHPLSITTLIHSIANALHGRYAQNQLCIQYAWWMIEALTQKTKSCLLTQSSITLTLKQRTTLHTWIQQQLIDKMPLQYQLGSVPFGNCSITVEPPLLIPRPETEQWCFDLIALLADTRCESFSLLDIGTGSGCIAIAIAKAFPRATIYATDINPHAVALAQKNAHLNHVSNITFMLSDLFTAFDASARFDIIVSNPPYISSQEWNQLDPSVSTWEDVNALVAEDDGIALLKKIITMAPYYLNSHVPFREKDIAQLVVEIGFNQSQRVQSLFSAAGFENITVKKDIYGQNRVVSGCLPHEAYRSS